MQWFRTNKLYRGFIEIDILLSIAVLSVLIVAVLGSLVYAQQSIVMSGQRERAVFLADGGMEAILNIRDSAFNELFLTQSGVNSTPGNWVFTGEGTDDTLGIFTRTITFTDICRDATNAITACPGVTTDAQSKKVTITMTWTSIIGVPQTLTRTKILTNWDSIDWVQTNWLGGSGQVIWLNDTMYDTDNGSVDITNTGQVSLTQLTVCSGNTTPFTTPANYTYNATDIEVAGGNAQLIASAGTVSSIQTPVLDLFEYDILDGSDPSFIPISGDIYAVAYTGPAKDGFVATVQIDSAGLITPTVIDILEFDIAEAKTPVIINVSGDIYAIAYSGPGKDGWLKTISIDSLGAISNTVIDFLEFDPVEGKTPDIINVSGNTFAIAYSGPGKTGFFSTVSIDGLGNIGATVISSYEYDTLQGKSPSIEAIGGNIFAIAYEGNGGAGYVVTLNIDPSGTVTPPVIDTLEFDIVNGKTPAAVNVSGDIYAVVYEGPAKDGFLATVQIDSAGVIGPTVLDVFEFDAVEGKTPVITSVSGDIFAIAYSGPGKDGFVSTVQIDILGNITNTLVDKFEYNLVEAKEPDIKNISGNIFAIAYSGPGKDGFVSTVEINPAGTITAGVIDTFEYDLVEAKEPSLENVFGNIFAIAYQGTGKIGNLVTVEIDTLGNITNTVMDTLTFDATRGRSPDITNVSGDYYAIAYRGPGDTGWLKTVQIDAFGNIANTVVSTFEFDTVDGRDPTISNVSGDVFAIAYSGVNSTGMAATVNINTVGIITQSTIASSTFDALAGKTPFVIGVGGSAYAIFYEGDAKDGFVKTITIDSSGFFGGTLIDTFIYDIVKGKTPDLIPVAGDYYAIAYEGSVGGWLSTINISSIGAIANTVVDTLQFDVSAGKTPSIVKVVGDSFAIAYEGAAGDGFVTIADISTLGIIPAAVTDTFEFDIADGRSPDMLVQNGILEIAYRGVSKDGFIVSIGLVSSAQYPTNRPTIEPTTSYTGANFEQWTTFSETATKNGGEIYYQLSDDDGLTWYYWSGSAWVVAGATNYNTAAVTNQYIYAFPVTSGKILFKAFLESDGTQFVQLDEIVIGCARLQMEVATASLDNNWTTVNFTNTYSSPIVVASHNDAVNTLPASVRVRNITPTQFDIRLQNPSGTVLSSDQVTYMVVEEGVWTLNGIKFEAHDYSTVTTGSSGGGWGGDTQLYSHTFATAPIVLHQIQTNNDPAWTTSFVRSNATNFSPPDNLNFQIGLNTAETATTHGSERLGWIAYDTTIAGNVGGVVYESVQTPDTVVGVDNACTTFPYSNTFAVAPRTIVSQQEMDGANGGWAVMCSNSLAQVGIYIDEDQVNDAERAHTTETTAFISFDGDVAYSSTSGGGGGYQTTGQFTSSAFDTGANSSIQHIEWDETITGCPTCDIAIEVRAAPDLAGAPGTWSAWYGSGGANTTFNNPDGSLISTDLNGNQWIQYRVTLTGNGSVSPILEEIRFNYN